MFNLQEFLKELDYAYQENPKGLEELLQRGLRDARFSGHKEGILVILNELLGYYRVMSNAEGCERCVREALALCTQMGIAGTENYATVLLNIATAYRVLGRMKEAETYYMETLGIYTRSFTEPDYRMASLHNNLSLLYSETGRLAEAKNELNQAMEVITQLAESDVEIAITHTNLGSLCFQLQEIEEGTAHMKKAVEIFEKEPDRKDAHYASALSGLGQAYYLGGNLEGARECYLAALQEIKACYGENEYYRVTEKNLMLVEDLLKRKQAVKENPMTGMELSRAYYERFGKPMLEEKYPEYLERMAVGLSGEGSECLGFDDEYSTDHDFGPSFCIWLTEEDYNEIGEKLQKDYENLPGEFMGRPARNATREGGGRVGVMTMDAFFHRYTGTSKPPAAEELSRWMAVPQEALLTVTNGEVFSDPLGEFTERRSGFAACPEKVRRCKLAMALGRMAQSGQYNFGRMLKRDDRGAAFLALSEFVSAAADAGYLLNRQYAPFYKWKMKGMESFRCLTDLKDKLEELIDGGAFDRDAQEKIERICGMFVRELRAQNLTDSDELFLEVQKDEVMRKA